ncbi:hypothetical protein MetfoDRAFT_1833 [Methanotorris formicicus Mc-S-70]|uniref:Uncharacterized protein n=1 Tax=Methanotorris formicicus Mc-S-70 TaxID=647171 RepID=H1L1A9_9EURY|nr:hypothetical protein MetfoDRAFT_1833 [Methanotorris formicicus Mc-S-70]
MDKQTEILTELKKGHDEVRETLDKMVEILEKILK